MPRKRKTEATSTTPPAAPATKPGLEKKPETSKPVTPQATPTSPAKPQAQQKGVKGLIDKGKAFQSKVDGSVDISQVDYAAAYASELIYTGVTAPLHAIYRLITGVAAFQNKKAIVKHCTIITLVMTGLLTLIAILKNDPMWGAYIAGGGFAWYFMYSTTKENTSRDLDAEVEAIVKIDPTADARGGPQQGHADEVKQFVSEATEVTDDMYL